MVKKISFYFRVELNVLFYGQFARFDNKCFKPKWGRSISLVSWSTELIVNNM